MDNNKPLSKPSLTRALISLEIALIDLSSKESREYIENAIKDIEAIKKLNAELVQACEESMNFINETIKKNLPESQHILNGILNE